MVNKISEDIIARRSATRTRGPETAFIILDSESVPDGRLVSRVKYPEELLTPEDAIQRAQAEARELSPAGSDFLPVTYQIPVAVCVLRVGADFSLQALSCLDAPEYRSEEIVKKFWAGTTRYKAKLVTFNGRGFDLPLLELAAFRYGLSARDYFHSRGSRYNGNNIDLFDFLSNFGACRMTGGLNLLAKMLGKPGKMALAGDQVYNLWREGRTREINDYCMFDTLDTYFVFLRTRVLLGEITLDDEKRFVERAKTWLNMKAMELPALGQYLNNWTE